jgi:hypothetical protein
VRAGHRIAVVVGGGGVPLQALVTGSGLVRITRMNTIVAHMIPIPARAIFLWLLTFPMVEIQGH